MSEIETDGIGEELDVRTVDRDPIGQFQNWFQAALAANLILPEAMTLATATRSGKPSARMVLLKQVDHRGFVFYTNYHSQKSQELDDNPFAALVFYWAKLDCQVRIEGSVTRISDQESDDYFRSRPRDSQIGAAASPQSEVIEDRAVLEKRFHELEELYRDAPVKRPSHWGGYRLAPARIEFWKSRPGRLHDRIAYELEADGTWTIKRLAP